MCLMYSTRIFMNINFFDCTSELNPYMLNCLKSIAMQKKYLLHLHIHILTIFLLTHLILISLRTPSFAFLPPLLIVIRQVNLGTVLARL